MKHLLAWLLVLSMILSGCGFGKTGETGGTGSTEPGHTENLSTEVSGSEESQPPVLTLMDDAVQVEGSENLYFIPNAEAETMAGPEMVLMGNSLLMWVTEVGEKGCGITMKRISLENGELLGSTHFASDGFINVQVSGDRIGVCDSGTGIMRIFDSGLQEVKTFEVGQTSAIWYFNEDLSTVYGMDWKEGVISRDLVTGEENKVLTNVTDVYVRNVTGKYLVLSYTNLENQYVECRLLNLQNGALEHLPITKNVVSAVYGDGTWLLGDRNRWGTYYLVDNGERKTAIWQANRFDMLLPENHLFTLDESGHTLSLYDVQGTFVSQCRIPDQYYMESAIVWSDLWNGYFFVSGGEDGNCRLMFWDVEKKVSGENFTFQPEIQKKGDKLEIQDLYERAGDISERFGVEIHIADQCQLEYNMFKACEVSDREDLTRALDIVEQALSVYPDGFLKQLKYGEIRSICFELVGSLTATDSSVYNGSYAGVASEDGENYFVVLDIYSLWAPHIYHELTHVLDKRLAWDAQIREGALFSEEKWMELQPEGFAYAETYLDLSDDIWDYVNTGYFVDDYACRYPTEDRARMMEVAIDGGEYLYKQNPPLREKLTYYSACIRDCMNTTGWPEVTVWEKMLDDSR